MIIDTESIALKWILTKFLKDSLDFLSDPSAKGIVRKDWINTWMECELTDERIKTWMPNDDH